MRSAVLIANHADCLSACLLASARRGQEAGQLDIGVRYTRIDRGQGDVSFGVAPYFMSSELGPTANASNYFDGGADSGVALEVTLFVRRAAILSLL